VRKGCGEGGGGVEEAEIGARAMVEGEEEWKGESAEGGRGERETAREVRGGKGGGRGRGGKRRIGEWRERLWDGCGGGRDMGGYECGAGRKIWLGRIGRGAAPFKAQCNETLNRYGPGSNFLGGENSGTTGYRGRRKKIRTGRIFL